MKKLLFVLCPLFFLVIADANAAVISKISVVGNRRMDAESVRLLADVKPGDNVNSEQLNQIAKKLNASGLFSKSEVKMIDDVLRINVTEAPVIDTVTVEGNDAVSTEDLKKEIRLAPRGAYDESVIGADVARMLTVYQRQGYFGTKIEPKRIDLEGGRVNVVYEVKEGHPTYIRSIDFTGNKKFSDGTLGKEILSNEHAWWKFMASFDTYDEDRIQYDQQLLRQFYMRNGYVDFRIKNVQGTFAEDREYYSVTFDVEEGNRYKFGTIGIENPFPDISTDDLSDKIEMSSGDTYNIDQVETTISNLRTMVASYGYAFINVDVVPDKDDKARTISMVFKIQKTNRMYINNVAILGNVRTFDRVAEQQLQIRPGDPFSLQEIETGRQRMMRSRYYKSVDIVPTRVNGTNLMNLDIKVEEQPTGELSGGLGWSNINGFMIDAGITENNFMGRGQTVQLRGQIAQYQKQMVFSFTEPYLFDRQLSGGFDVNYTMYNYSQLGSFGYDRDSFTVAGRLGWRLTDNWSQTLRLSASFDQNYDLHVPGGWQAANLYTLGTQFRYYNLDTDFAQQTHDGIVANFGASYTGFGSTETFMRYDASVTGLFKFLDNRWQLKSNLDFGMLQTIGDEYVSRIYRYFLGGETLRGFNIAGIGSRNWAYINYALGGLWKINGSTQLNFPIFIPDEHQVKGFVFLDYGMLGKPPKAEYYYYPPIGTCPPENPVCANNIDSDLRVSYGVGVYWNTPMGPMNFSWGWPFLKHTYDREQRFLLSFATQF
ncbi:MAG: outer membrane protein assembly factor BamA [Rickettsiales bacterium]|jgi:outer membrane protein insertion porin family|nr:outer membrane protein assembly factor BamA [Rickettsiales bacterium]